ncbi:MAG: LacI family DNA-binding transcriptional regulator [Verrucomicrobia bacterium]|nr:LacI family DNA-binding transcriptional regulator [Verrucomicrobiota bacterium]
MVSINQHEIARRLSLSQSTVAGALAGNPRFNVETRKRVVAEASRLGYRPHRYARILRKGRSGFIGMIQCAGYMQLIWKRAQCAAHEVHRHGYQLLTSDAFWFADRDKTACEVMLDAGVEGVVLVSPTYPFDLIRRAGVPVVCFSGTPLPGVPQVRADTRQGMYDLTRHLLGLGYRRLALLTQWPMGKRSAPHCYYVTERIAGFRQAAVEAGLSEPDAAVVFEEYYEEHVGPYQTGKISMSKLLAESDHRHGGTGRPEAVLCSNDEWAAGALAACAEAGVRVPEDIAVTGFDNTLASGYGAVPLTTVEQPVEEMARCAVEILMKRIRGDPTVAGSESEMIVKMPGKVIVRHSCGAALRNQVPENAFSL